MVGAHAILDSISSSIFKGLLMAAFKGLLVDRCITHVLNTDSMPVQTIIQGPIDHSGGLHGKPAAVKVNKATQQAGDCQLCSGKGHMASNCKGLSKDLCKKHLRCTLTAEPSGQG